MNTLTRIPFIGWTSLLFWACTTETTSTTDKVEEQVTEQDQDLDNDGYLASEDCDDNDASIFPGAVETCDGIDNNCDSQIDEGVVKTFYVDTDGDGFGDPENTVIACDAPDGTVPNGNDCDDSDANAFPSNAEICDDVDNDCNGQVDENLPSEWYLDGDGDGFGATDSLLETCNPPQNYVQQPGDCDDTHANAFPNAVEVCDTIDNDCDGQTDEGLTITVYLDADYDGHGDSFQPMQACEVTYGYSLTGGDCDDINSYVYPGNAEFCDDVDNNCDGQIDEGVGSTGTPWYLDNDGDGIGNSAISYIGCEQDPGYVPVGGDCDDNDGANAPNRPEVCDGQDNNCNSLVDDADTQVLNRNTWYQDADSDGIGGNTSQLACAQPSGFVSSTGDCNDSDANIYPNAPEICDGIINTCGSNSLPSSEVDNDGDGYVECTIASGGWHGNSGVIGGSDCDDSNATHHELLDWYFDDDGDGYGDATNSFLVCVPPPNGYVLDSSDCDDENSNSYPNAPEVCDGYINNCLGNALPANEVDNDGDGYVECTIGSNTWNGLGILGGNDCNDGNANVHPNATEVCSGPDMNCDQQPPDHCSSCLEIKQVGSDTGDGIYTIDTTAKGEVDVYCNMTIDGGGWTMVQRTVWDFNESGTLLTNFSNFYSSNTGTPAQGDAFRLAGTLWSELNVELDHMLVHTPRDASTGNNCTTLYYLGTNGTFSLSSSSLSVSTNTFSSTVNFFSDSTFDAIGMGSNCPGIYSAVPWFYTHCCTTCPTFAGNYYTIPRPMASYINHTGDLFGNTSSNGCPSGAAVSSRGYEAMNSMEYYLR